MEARDGRVRRRRRHEDAHPRHAGKALYAELVERRRVGQHRVALQADLHQRAHFAVLHEFGERLHRAHHQRHVPGDEIGRRRRAAAIRHVAKLHAVVLLDLLHRQMPDRAGAAGRIGQPVRLLLRLRDHFRECFVGLRRMRRDDVGNGADHHHRLERRRGVERQVEQHRIDRVAVVGEQDRAAVARLLRDIAGAGGAASARAVLDDDVLAEAVLELLGDDARRDVGRPPRRERRDKADGVLRTDGFGPGDGAAERRTATNAAAIAPARMASESPARASAPCPAGSRSRSPGRPGRCARRRARRSRADISAPAASRRRGGGRAPRR